MIWFILFVGFFIAIGLYGNYLAKNGKLSSPKKCPYCQSTDWQYAGQTTIGARDAKVKTQYKANLNPLKPFTLVDKKEKVVKKAKAGITFDEFICMNCGKRFK